MSPPAEPGAYLIESGKIPHGWKPARGGVRKVKVKNEQILAALRVHYPGEWRKVYRRPRWNRDSLFRTPMHWKSLGDQGKVKSVILLPVNLSLANLLDSEVLSDEGVRCLVGWQTLILVDLLQRQCITVRYAERVLFNLDVVQRLKRRRLKDCVEVVDWGMQLEDWEEYTPEHLPEALLTIARLAQHLLEKVGKRKTETPALIKPRRHAGAQPVRD